MIADKFPPLYKRTSTGKIQMWQIGLEAGVTPYGANSPTVIYTIYGQVDGKLQRAEDTITEGKNIGKANETTVLDQAIAEAKSQWEKKVKKGYVQNLEDAEQGKIDTNMITGGIEPMLAYKYEDQGHKIKFPALVQPKLDGHRCVAIYQNGTCTLWSRTRKAITGLPHVQRAVEEMLSHVNFDEPIILDGELYNHDYHDKFEQLTSFIRSATPKPGAEVVQYWVYDVIVDKPMSERAEMLDLLMAHQNKTVIPVQAEEAVDTDTMMEIFFIYLDNGFEGLMVRNTNGMYKNKRSYDLQKVKVMQDAEFEIVDITEGRGKMAGKAMFNCVTAEGKPFRVKMKGSLDSLAHYLDHKDDYIGRELTVKYQNLSADGIPRFPIGERIREDI